MPTLLATQLQSSKRNGTHLYLDYGHCIGCAAHQLLLQQFYHNLYWQATLAGFAILFMYLILTGYSHLFKLLQLWIWAPAMIYHWNDGKDQNNCILLPATQGWIAVVFYIAIICIACSWVIFICCAEHRNPKTIGPVSVWVGRQD